MCMEVLLIKTLNNRTDGWMMVRLQAVLKKSENMLPTVTGLLGHTILMRL